MYSPTTNQLIRLDKDDKAALVTLSKHLKLPEVQVIRIAIRRMHVDELLGRSRKGDR